MPVIGASVVEEAIDIQELHRGVGHPSCGATVFMTGQVRDRHEGRAVERLEYHAYREMASTVLLEVAQEAIAGQQGLRIAAVHRIGALELGEISVAVAVSAPHRREAFEACRLCIDTLKRRLPVWKKEYGPQGTVWQEGSPLESPGAPPSGEHTASGEGT